MIGVYFSARLARRDELRALRDSLPHNVVCTSRWLDGEPQDLADIADMDRADVVRADVLVTFTDEPDPERTVVAVVLADSSGFRRALPAEPGSVSPHPWAHRGGRHVEFGLAWGLGKVCIVCGPRENFAHHARDVRVCATWDECVAMLATLAAASEIGLDEAERKAIALAYGDETEERGW